MRMAEERGGEGLQASAEASGLQGSLDRYFGLAAAGTSVASELRERETRSSVPIVGFFPGKEETFGAKSALDLGTVTVGG